MRSQGPKILLSEGSSLSSREAITALGLAGHRVDLVSSDPMCLGRFSRFVRRVHRAPASGADPDGYLAAVIETVKTGNIDALIPVHEQAYLFAAARKQLPDGLGIALAEFETFEQVQSKASFADLLTRLNVTQPKTELVRSADEFAGERPYPFFVKAAFGTASAGVWRVSDTRQRDALLLQHEQYNAFAEGLLVQARSRDRSSAPRRCSTMDVWSRATSIVRWWKGPAAATCSRSASSVRGFARP